MTRHNEQQTRRVSYQAANWLGVGIPSPAVRRPFRAWGYHVATLASRFSDPRPSRREHEPSGMRSGS
jgi:hypothetical protein